MVSQAFLLMWLNIIAYFFSSSENDSIYFLFIHFHFYNDKTDILKKKKR